MEKATRICSGLYMYKGWKIEEQNRLDNAESTCWNMTPPNMEYATDSEKMLRQCKAFIDLCEDGY